jgi:hypothetical protein
VRGAEQDLDDAGAPAILWSGGPERWHLDLCEAIFEMQSSPELGRLHAASVSSSGIFGAFCPTAAPGWIKARLTANAAAGNAYPSVFRAADATAAGSVLHIRLVVQPLDEFDADEGKCVSIGPITVGAESDRIGPAVLSAQCYPRPSNFGPSKGAHQLAFSSQRFTCWQRSRNSVHRC